MPHSRPTNIANRGDAHRITHAAGAFIIELSMDPRVQAHHRAWLAAWTEGRRQLDQFLDRAAAPLNEAAIRAQVIDPFAADMRAGLQRFVAAELPLKPAWVPWVAAGLDELFHLGVYNARHPDTPKEFGIPVVLRQGMPPGRLPRQEGADIDRNVRWFYRARIAVAPVPKQTLAEEYAARAERHTDARSVVQNGITQAEALLDLVAARAVRLPPPGRSPKRSVYRRFH